MLQVFCEYLLNCRHVEFSCIHLFKHVTNIGRFVKLLFVKQRALMAIVMCAFTFEEEAVVSPTGEGFELIVFILCLSPYFQFCHLFCYRVYYFVQTLVRRICRLNVAGISLLMNTVFITRKLRLMTYIMKLSQGLNCF
jgi:hypothetical protein